MKNFLSCCFAAVMVTLLPALLLYGGLVVPKSELIFSHLLHVGDMEINCADCHTAIPASDQATDKNIPTHNECGECHDDAIENDGCSMCHVKPDKIVPLQSFEWKIIFSHNKHLSRELDCVDCHRGVEKAVTLTDKNMPEMATCTSCHNGRMAPVTCSLCHSNPDEIKRMSHPAGWKHSHKYEASQNDATCRTCHPDSDYCLDCHEGDNLQQTSHPLNYQYTHMLDAKGKEKDCMVCHTAQSFCNDCHTREEVMPLNHSSATWPALDHGTEAARDLEACAACHDEDDPTCLRCHRDSDNIQGTDPSPHGPGFSSERGEGPWHDDPSYLCYRCHVPGRNLIEGGFCRYCHALSSGGSNLSPLRGETRDAF